MLDEAEKCNNQHIVSWQQDGLAFRVYRPDEFVTKIMPHYFHQTQFRSFQRMVRRAGRCL
jgi:HSF-type DNA-binding